MENKMVTLGRKRFNFKGKQLGQKRTGDKKVLVSLASNVGGGRLIIPARTPEEAAQKAELAFLTKKKKGLRKSTIDTIVTDNRGKQSFFGR